MHGEQLAAGSLSWSCELALSTRLWTLLLVPVLGSMMFTEGRTDSFLRVCLKNVPRKQRVCNTGFLSHARIFIFIFIIIPWWVTGGWDSYKKNSGSNSTVVIGK